MHANAHKQVQHKRMLMTMHPNMQKLNEFNVAHLQNIYEVFGGNAFILDSHTPVYPHTHILHYPLATIIQHKTLE